MKEIAIDTNIAIEFLNGKDAIIKKLNTYEVLFLPITVSGELLFGLKNSKRKAYNLNNTHKFIALCVELDVTNIVAEEYSDIRLALKKKGKPIPENDIWIAAICKTNNLPLMTNDKHFENIVGLKLLKV